MAQVFADEGITVRTGVEISRVDHDEGFTITAGDLRVEAEQLLVAAGRSNNVTDIGLETVGLDPSASQGRDGRADASGGEAVGHRDITGTARYTHVSTIRARWRRPTSSATTDPFADYRAVSRVTFTEPEIGSVGSERGAGARQGSTYAPASPTSAGSARGWLDGAGNRVTSSWSRTRRPGCWWCQCRRTDRGDLVALLALAVHARSRRRPCGHALRVPDLPRLGDDRAGRPAGRLGRTTPALRCPWWPARGPR
jgi:hypothetical protein